MKTPEEIKKGLECCQHEECNGCPYDSICEIHYVTCAKDALAYIQQLEAQVGKDINVPRWISVEERLPSGFDVFYEGEDRICEPAEYIVKVAGAELATAAMFDGANFIPADYDGITDGRMFADRVTHWMSLPEPPKEG